MATETDLGPVSIIVAARDFSETDLMAAFEQLIDAFRANHFSRGPLGRWNDESVARAADWLAAKYGTTDHGGAG